MKQVKLYFRLREICDLINEPNIDIVRRQLQNSGSLIRLPGSRRLLVLPIDAMRDLYPHMWDRYCADNAHWGSEVDCEHPNPERLPGELSWCPLCGGIRKPHQRWRQPVLVPDT